MNESSHRIMPIFVSDVEFTLLFQNVFYTFPVGENQVHELVLDVGENTMLFTTKENGYVNVEFLEEVF